MNQSALEGCNSLWADAKTPCRDRRSFPALDLWGVIEVLPKCILLQQSCKLEREEECGAAP